MGVLFLVLGVRAMFRGIGVAAGAMVFVKLLGAIRAIEFMAFAGKSSEGDGHDEQGKTFHRGAT